MSENNNNNDILLNIYREVGIISNDTQRIISKQDEHAKVIEGLAKDRDDHGRRIEQLEEFRVNNLDLLSKVKDSVEVTEKIVKNKWKWIVGVIFFIFIISGTFTLWVVDYKAIDVLWARHIAQYLIDPGLDFSTGHTLSHNMESQ